MQKRQRRRYGFKDEKSYREEMWERDRIRQEYYQSLENGTAPPPVPVIEEESDPEPAQEPEYYTRIRTRGWYDVIGPDGTAVNDAAMRLNDAEAKAKELNNGA
jgi:hypothetical protein